MAVVVNSNLASLRVQRAFASTTRDLQQSYERLASGLRINRAGDDAAGLAVSSTLTNDSRVYSQGVRNLNDALSSLSITSSTLTQLSDVTQRLIELSEQASNGVYSTSQRSSLDKEAGALIQEYNRLTASASFNGSRLLAGTTDSLGIQAGYSNISFGITDQIERRYGTNAFGSFLDSSAAADIVLVMNSTSSTTPVSVLSFQIGSSFVNVNNPDGTGGYAFDYGSILTNAVVSAVSGDFNNDGRDEAIVAGATGYQRVQSDASWDTAVAYSIANVTDITKGDFNGDGKLDFAVVNNTGSVQAFFGSGTGTFTAQTVFSTGRGAAGQFAAGDFNGDGKADLAISNGASIVDVFTSQGNGSFTLGSSATVAGISAVEASDLNGDGYADLLVGGTGGVSVRLGVGNATFAAATTYAGTGSSAITLGDLNSDGITDMLTATSILFGNRDGSFNTPVAQGYATKVGAFADANGDGVNDLFVISAGTGNFGVHLQQTDLTTNIKNQFLGTQANARTALTYFKQVLANIGKEQGAVGASMSRLESTVNVLMQTRENFDAAASRITDVDVAEETSRLVRSRLLQQAGAAILGQANQLPALALQLLNR